MATSVRLEPELEKRLDHLAQSTGRTKAFYLREMIMAGLEDLEDLYLAEQATIERRAGRLKSVPIEEVMKRYGLED